MGPPTKTRKPEPAVIEYKSMRFLITDRPSEGNMDKFIAVRTVAISLICKTALSNDQASVDEYVMQWFSTFLVSCNPLVMEAPRIGVHCEGCYRNLSI